MATGTVSPAISIEISEGSVKGNDLRAALTSIKLRRFNDKWALPYISILHAQPLLEAFDDDGTTFVPIYCIFDSRFDPRVFLA